MTRITRRPLCLAALVWLGVLAAGLALGRFKPLEGYEEVKALLDGQGVTITGRVVKITGTGAERTCYLDHIVLEQAEKMNTDNAISSVTHAGEIFYAENPDERKTAENNTTEKNAVENDTAKKNSGMNDSAEKHLTDSQGIASENGRGNGIKETTGEFEGSVCFPASCQVVLKSEEGFPGISCDDTVRSEGEAVFPTVPTNPGQFDDEGYCLNRDIIFRMYDGSTVVTKKGRGIRHLLQGVRDSLAGSFSDCLGAEEAAILTGITLGDSAGISKGTRSLFREGGIAHILAISGLHVNLLAMALYSLLRRGLLPVSVCCVLCLGVFFLYMLMTGMSLSCVRAFILFAVWCLAQVSGRKVDVPTSLALAASILCSIYPGLLTDGAFYLSFGCVFALFLIPAPLEKLLFGEKRPPRWGRALAASLAAALGTMPICAWFYYRITPWAVAVNLLVLPCMGMLFVFGCIGGLLGILFPPAGSFVLSVCHYLLRMFVLACRLERKLPFGVLITGRPAFWQVALYYLWLAALLYSRQLWGKMLQVRMYRGRMRRRRMRRRRSRIQRGRMRGAFLSLRRKRIDSEERSQINRESILGERPINRASIRETKGAGWAGRMNDRRRFWKRVSRPVMTVLLISGCILILKVRIWPAFRVTFLDVGQGDCILIQTGDISYLVDCGSSSVEGVWGRRVSPALQCYGITRLDGVFVSHGDSDHINGLQEWLQGYERNLTGDNCADISADTIFLSLAAADRENEKTADNEKMPDGQNEKQDTAVAQAQGNAADEAAQRLGALAVDKGLSVVILEPGDRVLAEKKGRSDNSERDPADAGADGFTCLYPSSTDIEAVEADTNMSSMVLEYTKGSTTILLTGDIENEGEERLADILQERAASRSEGDFIILKVGHHGSRNATSRNLLQTLQPDLAVISCGKDNRYGHPAQVVLQRLGKVGTDIRRTDLEGAVILEKNKGGE